MELANSLVTGLSILKYQGRYEAAEKMKQQALNGIEQSVRDGAPQHANKRQQPVSIELNAKGGWFPFYDIKKVHIVINQGADLAPNRVFTCVTRIFGFICLR